MLCLGSTLLIHVTHTQQIYEWPYFCLCNYDIFVLQVQHLIKLKAYYAAHMY
jgi:hypothetical protein